MNVPYAEVIGDPISHSRSPLIHRFWLAKLGLSGDYRRKRVAPGDLANYLDRACADADWRGCNVTIPHKISIMNLVADPAGVRETIGAMNTVTRAADGSVQGTNTDAAGFGTTIEHLDLAGAHALIIGAGGAARAVLFGLRAAGIGFVTLQNRDVGKAAELLARFGMAGEARPLGSPPPAASLVVNASALGMVGMPTLDVDLDGMPPEAVVYDAVYAPLETPLLTRARARGLRTIDGLEMLVAQAALAFALFFGVEPLRAFDRELRAALTA